MALDQNGVPAVVPALTGEAADAIVAPLVTPAPLSSSFGAVAGAMLRGFSDPAVVVVDPIARRVSGTSNPALAAQLLALDGNAATLTPDAGQTGRSLAWTPAQGALNPDQWAPLSPALAALTGASKPRYSVESLIQRLVALMTADNGMPYGAKIIVDQINGRVGLLLPLDAGDAEAQSAQIAGIEAGTTDFSTVELSGGISEAAGPARIFEGGATS